QYSCAACCLTAAAPGAHPGPRLEREAASAESTARLPLQVRRTTHGVGRNRPPWRRFAAPAKRWSKRALWPLLMDFPADPEDQEKRQRQDQHHQRGRKADVAVADGVIHCVPAAKIPDQQREDGNHGGDAERKKGRRKRQQKAGEQAESAQGKPQDRFSRREFVLCVLHGGRGLARLEYRLDGIERT